MCQSDNQETTQHEKEAHKYTHAIMLHGLVNQGSNSHVINERQPNSSIAQKCFPTTYSEKIFWEMRILFGFMQLENHCLEVEKFSPQEKIMTNIIDIILIKEGLRRASGIACQNIDYREDIKKIQTTSLEHRFLIAKFTLPLHSYFKLGQQLIQ